MSEHKKIKYIRKPTEQHWVGDGFHVHTLIQPGGGLYESISPFILMDYAAPTTFSPTQAKRGVGEHPHRGFETVTFVYDGEVSHRDSAGGGGTIGKGDVQWMTAASGVVHEEFHSEDFAKSGGDFEMVQLWVNLPAADKMSSPKYQGIRSNDFPVVELNSKVEAKVFTGNSLGVEGTASTYTDMDIFDLKILEGGEFDLSLPSGRNTIILVRKGKLLVEEKNINEKDLIIFERVGEIISLKAIENTELLILSAVPIDEPIANYGPFVMNTAQELQTAMSDYQNGKMGHLN
jgi:redox-sensitive bicupin YhaK (pirin superfamily)